MRWNRIRSLHIKLLCFIQAIKDWHESGWTPMGRLGTPADVGNAVYLLCMNEASFITGQTIHVDRGGSIMDTAFPPAIQGF